MERHYYKKKMPQLALKKSGVASVSCFNECITCDTFNERRGYVPEWHASLPGSGVSEY